MRNENLDIHPKDANRLHVPLAPRSKNSGTKYLVIESEGSLKSRAERFLSDAKDRFVQIFWP